MQISKRERQLLILTSTVVVVGLNLFLFFPLLARWQKMNLELKAKRQELAKEQATIDRTPEWRRSYEELGRNLKQAERFESATDVIKKVDEVGGAAGILTQTKRPMKEEEHEVYHEWAVEYHFETTVESLVKFLHGLQTSSGFMTVEQLNVSAKPDNSGILRGDIQIRALVAKEGKPAS